MTTPARAAASAARPAAAAASDSRRASLRSQQPGVPRGATIQYFQAGAFAAGSNVYMAAPGQNANQLAHAAQLAHGGAQISDPAGRRPLGDPRDHHHDGTAARSHRNYPADSVEPIHVDCPARPGFPPCRGPRVARPLGWDDWPPPLPPVNHLDIHPPGPHRRRYR